MSISFELRAEARTDQGKGASRRLRRAGKVPAILYGGGNDPQAVTLDHTQLTHNLENEAFYSHILTIDVAGDKQKAILRDLQRHPSRPIVLHVDLMRVSETEKIRVSAPLHFTGEDVAPGVKEAGGLVSHDLNEVNIECLPKHLPEFIEVDISSLNIGDSLHLADLAVPEGVELLDLTRGQDHMVVSIHARKVEVEEVEEGEVAAEGEAPEAAAGGEPEAGGEGD